MDAELRIGNDPATWYFRRPATTRSPPGLGQPGAPFAIDVIAPLRGRLLLHPQAAGKVALTLPISPVGWNPSGVCWPKSPLLYVSSATGPTHANPGYTLARGYQLAALEEEILTAMAQGGIVTVMLDEGLGKGMLSLSGATLAYAVLCPPTAAPTAAG